MKEINKDLVIRDIEVSSYDFDVNDFDFPVEYRVSIEFFGREYELMFTTKNLKEVDKYGKLYHSGCEGDQVLYNSMYYFFENNKDEADILVELIQECWESFKEEDSPYNYKGEI